MKNDRINYRVQFYSYWHCGSGLAAGSDVDALVIKDDDGLPFIPGKTIKGLIKQAVREIADFKGLDLNMDDIFGSEGLKQSPLFFSDASMEDAAAIKANNLQQYLYGSVSNTAIDEAGIAKEHSLRKTEVVLPCSLTGQIIGIPSQEVNDLLVEALSYIKNMGLHRHRGFGRCRIVATFED